MTEYAFASQLYRPETDNYPGRVIVEVTGFRSTPGNAEARLQYVANELGIYVVGLFRPGTGATEVDPALCEAFSPENFGETMQDSLGEIYEAIREHVGDAELVGHGPSAGGVFVAAMALGFERVQFTDAFYLPTSESPETGVSRFLEYLQSGERDKPVDPDAPQLAPEKNPVNARTAARQGAAEIAHYAPLLLSAVGGSLALELANSPMLPMHVVHIGHTFTGDHFEANHFARELRATRRAAEMALNHPEGQGLDVAAELRVTNMPRMWHSDLSSRPDIMAKLLKQTLELDCRPRVEGL